MRALELEQAGGGKEAEDAYAARAAVPAADAGRLGQRAGAGAAGTVARRRCRSIGVLSLSPRIVTPPAASV